MRLKFSKKIRLFAIMVPCAIALCFLFSNYFRSSNNKTITVHAALTEADKCLLQNGDVILRRGEGLVSDEISYVLKDQPYDETHSGIILRRGDSIYVVHSIADHEHHID